jgi:short-subunit dehydrogenase
MSRGNNLFWISTVEKAASQIYDAIVKKKKHAYITKRWRLVAWLLKIVPDWIYNKT